MDFEYYNFYVWDLEGKKILIDFDKFIRLKVINL